MKVIWDQLRRHRRACGGGCHAHNEFSRIVVIPVLSGNPGYGPSMTWWSAALWGLLGGGLVETLDLYTEIRTRGALPWHKPSSKRRDRTRPAPRIYVLGTFLRLLMAGGVAAAAGASAMVSAPWIGIGAGVAAPLILERLAAQPTIAPGRLNKTDPRGGADDEG